MNHLRPECGTDSTKPAPTNGTAYFLIYTAVQHQDGLAHGRLHDRGRSCAVGSFFDDNPNLALYNNILDEVAAVNDSVPHYTPQQRKAHVERWLKWKLQQLGMTFKGRKVTQP